MTERAFGQHLPPEAEARVERIVAEMTVPELVGQMVGTPPHADVDRLVAEVADHHLGSVHFGDTPHNTPRAKAEVANRVQRAAMDASRFDVPVFLRAMAEHGHAAVAGSTVFPQQLGLAATRDPDLCRRIGEVAAAEMRATGVQSTSSPIGDVARDARWGRIPETFGESPRLCGTLAAAMVDGYQGADDPVVAVTKHFPAYSEGVRGEDQAPNDVSRYTLRRVHVPPYADAIDAGTGGVMPCYNAIDGEPVHGSERFLRDLLREELGFDGFVLADYAAPSDLHGGHGVTAGLEESLFRMVRAGVDVFPSGGARFTDPLVSLVRDGELSVERVRGSARRVLRLKMALGLFEDPFVDPDEAAETLGNPDHRAVAREAARESMTLLTNDGLLPLDDPDSVFVTGPNADAIAHQHGGWGNVADPEPLGETVLEGLRDVAPAGTEVAYEPGATIHETLDLDAVRAGAADADVAVVVLGEPDYVHEFREGTTGFEADEFPRRDSISLPAAQCELAAVARETGTPTVGVLVTGRVLSTPELADSLAALLLAYQPGSAGGAVADVLFGDHNPGGALPVSVPRSEGQIPVRFNHLPYPTMENPAHLDAYDPLFEYGHGLSYTEFEYRALAVPDAVGPAETAHVEVTVANVGDRAGAEAVEAFVRDAVSSRVTPVRELAGATRVELDPGEERTVAFALDEEVLGVVSPAGERTVEPGTFEVTAGDLRAEFEVERRRDYDR
ncbi:MAG: glycoside hydrolase family 3 N-terminal domain-containing protein [Halobacteriaceae archaeon]